MLVTTRLLVNGRIYSSFAPDATSIAITDGTVVWVGDERAGRALHPAAEVEDLGGAFVTPGFVDTHVHITALGLNLVGLDLVGANSLDECLSRVRTFAAANPETAHPDAVIWGHGWDDTEWADQTPPSTEDLDAAPLAARCISRGSMFTRPRARAHCATGSPASPTLPDTRPTAR